MDQRDILQLIFGRVDALNGYWNLYIAVTLGVSGIMATGKPFTKQQATKILITLAFAVFAISNWSAISGTNEQRQELIKLVADPYAVVARLTEPPSYWLLTLYHVTLDLLVIGGLWLVPWPGD
ncbi:MULTISPECIES: hypothetical protein [Rhizobium]|uniref:Uncharacterized protein n=1 Tax=Rhizobium laguerreae TaxID=1076926 RepID=A0A7Y2W5V3_9HYPH|nr:MULTISPECIES: hypothetical protein [Rhizobium]MBY5445446.1 hypothetical protein [Rhizobium leguminosarum]NNG72773.1 hypothetical protein [Rhizobium laguerreae]NNH64655.1 hypothetical protein [Rhizobium laguerreae]